MDPMTIQQSFQCAIFMQYICSSFFPQYFLLQSGSHGVIHDLLRGARACKVEWRLERANSPQQRLKRSRGRSAVIMLLCHFDALFTLNLKLLSILSSSHHSKHYKCTSLEQLLVHHGQICLASWEIYVNLSLE